MNDQRLLERITLDPKIMVGKPVIKGTRLTVEYILNLLRHGSTIDEILDEYDSLSREDILACLLFARKALNDIDRESMTLPTAESSFRQGWQEAMRGDVYPVEDLWVEERCYGY